MDCIKFKELIQDYIDAELDNSITLTSEAKKEFEEHMEACSACKAEFTAYQKMINSVHALKPEKLPEGYCKRLNTRLKSSKLEVIRKKKFKYTRYIGIAAAFVLVALIVNFALNGIGNNSISMNDMAINDNYANYDAKGEADNGATAPEAPRDDAKSDESYVAQKNMTLTSQTSQKPSQEKIIKSGYLYIETIEFDKLIESLSLEIKNVNGYIENSEISIREKIENKSYRYANLNLRVPKEVFENIIIYIEGNSEVTTKNISETDVTKDYYDKQNILTNLQIQENRLRELYGKAETITDILALENEIRRIRTEIDTYSIDLSNIDDRVSMATIQLGIVEIQDKDINIKAEDGLWTKAKKGFIRTINNIIDFLQALIIWLISYILIIIPVVVVVIITYLRIKKNKKS